MRKEDGGNELGKNRLRKPITRWAKNDTGGDCATKLLLQPLPRTGKGKPKVRTIFSSKGADEKGSRGG